MADVFISHSTLDKRIADHICTYLEEQGIKCWIAPRDIPPGSEWAVSINNAISEVKVMIIVYGKNTLASTQVPKEMNLADKKRKAILTYKIDETDLEGAYDYYLSGTHWIEAKPYIDDYKMDEVYEMVASVVLGKKPAALGAKKVISATTKPQEDIKRKSNGNYDKIVKKSLPKKNSNKKHVLFGGIAIGILLFIILGIVGIFSLAERLKPDSEVLNPEEITMQNNDWDGDDLEVTPAEAFAYNTESGAVVITKYIGLDEVVVIPEKIEGMQVIGVDKFAFYQCDFVKTIVLPEGMTYIGEHAFEECASLVAVKLPETLMRIDRCAFNHCASLQSIIIPENVDYIGDYAFAKCNALAMVSMPSELSYLGNMAFSHCENLVDFNMPLTIDENGTNVFQNCTLLKVTIDGHTYDSVELEEFLQ